MYAGKKYHRPMKRHINNKGQELKTGHTKERALTGGRSLKEVNEVSMDDALSIQ
jgi:hypothetical protein